MKAEIKYGKLTITPESYSKEFALKQHKLSEEEWAGFIVFNKYEGEKATGGIVNHVNVKVGECDCDLSPGGFRMRCAEGRTSEYSEGLKPGKEIFGKEVFDREALLSGIAKACGYDKPNKELGCEFFGFEESIKKAQEFMDRNKGGFVDQSIKMCEKEEKEPFSDKEHGKIVLEFKCSDGTRSIIYYKDGKYTMLRKRGIFSICKFDFGEMVYLLKSFCGDTNLERDEILKKACEESEKVIDNSNRYSIEARVKLTQDIAYATSEAEKIIAESKEKSQKASEYYRVTTEECGQMIAECKKECEEMIENASTEAEKIRREAILNTSNITINVTGTTGNVIEDINNALAEKMGIKNRI